VAKRAPPTPDRVERDGALPDGFVVQAVARLTPYEPGKPVAEVQRELGLDRVVKLASNEGPFPPFPAALEAIDRSAHELNRYPDGGAWALRAALAARFDVAFEEVLVGAGADGIVDCISQAFLEDGDEIVCGWPSFPSYVIDALKLGAIPVRVPLRELRYDLGALLAAVTPRTKVVYICHPNNPTGTTNSRAELDAYFERVPEHVLTVLDQAYFEYLSDNDYPDGIEEYFKRGHRVAVVRTFSKIYGLAGLRVGWGVAAAGIATAVGKVRRAFDVVTPAQVAAVASLDDPAEVDRRRRSNVGATRGRARDPRAARAHLRASRSELRLRRHGRRRRERAVRRAASARSDREAARRLRRSRSGASDGRHGGRERVPRRGAQAPRRARVAPDRLLPLNG
jgi:histidinol-phosphate aminotransferase